MLTAEQLADIRSRINPAYRDTLGTESHERALLVGEIDQLRALLKRQQASYEREIEIERAAERERCARAAKSVTEMGNCDNWDEMTARECERRIREA